MENTIYDIILADKTKIRTILNGNNYITDDDIEKSVLSNENLSKVNIGGVDYSDMTCINFWTENGQTRFILRELTETEKLKQCIIELSSML